MSAELTGLCLNHSFESATVLCRRCGGEFCDTCAVVPFGPRKPLCKDCALFIGGVKAKAARPEMAGRLVRRRAKQLDKAVPTASAPTPITEGSIPTVTATPSHVPAGGDEPAIDWNNPFG